MNHGFKQIYPLSIGSSPITYIRFVEKAIVKSIGVENFKNGIGIIARKFTQTEKQKKMTPFGIPQYNEIGKA